MTTLTASTTETNAKYVGNDRLLFGMILGVLAFWLFSGTMLNISSTVGADLGVQTSVMNIAVSITALFSGIFIVVFGGLADRVGRVKVVQWGFIFNIVGSLLVGLAPSGGVASAVPARAVQRTLFAANRTPRKGGPFSRSSIARARARGSVDQAARERPSQRACSHLNRCARRVRHHPGQALAEVLPRADDAMFPPILRLIISSQPGSCPVDIPDADILDLDDKRFEADQRNDIARYIRHRFRAAVAHPSRRR